MLHVQRNSGFWHVLYFDFHSFTPQALRKQWERDYRLKGQESCMQIVGLDTSSHNTLYIQQSTDKHCDSRANVHMQLPEGVNMNLRLSPCYIFSL